MANNISNIDPYLFFEGRCEEAIEFYKRAFGAQVEMLMRYKESPEPPPPDCAPADGNKIMHASLRIGEKMVMMSDGRCSGKPNFQGFSLSLSAATESEAEKLFTALSNGGQVQMPLSKTFFATRFGMVQDRFGVGWMVIVHPNSAS